MANPMRSAGFGLFLACALAGCQTTGGGAAEDGYAGRGFSDGLSGREWSCGEGGRDCGASPEDQASYQAGWTRGWTQRCERAASSIATLRSCEQVLGGDWTSEAVTRQRASGRGRGGGAR